MTSTHHHHHEDLHSKHDTNLVPSKATNQHSQVSANHPDSEKVSQSRHHDHSHPHRHKHRQHEGTSYEHTWSIQITEEELGYLKFFQQMIPHIFSSPYHYELAIAPALGYQRAKELSYAMVTPITHDTFSYVSPDGKKHIGQVDREHPHTIIMEMHLSPLYGGSGGIMRKEFVEQELPPNGDIP
ncbi:uncharacterized protein L199_002614 [Kwoniella botswanensis]|uniref:uncharacterized protein n=1 Tax=Kwoniella botswanensis TaxID=1268659 RepID=UPI00315CB4BF